MDPFDPSQSPVWYDGMPQALRERKRTAADPVCIPTSLNDRHRPPSASHPNSSYSQRGRRSARMHGVLHHDCGQSRPDAYDQRNSHNDSPYAGDMGPPSTPAGPSPVPNSREASARRRSRSPLHSRRSRSSSSYSYPRRSPSPRAHCRDNADNRDRRPRSPPPHAHSPVSTHQSPPAVRVPGDNAYHVPSGMKVWRSPTGEIWSSPSPNVTGWPSRVSASGPLRFDAQSEWEDAVKPADSVEDHLITNPHLPNWWSPAHPHMAFHPRYPLQKTSGDDVLKSLAHVKSDDELVEQSEDGTWTPRLFRSWVDLSIMLTMVYGILYIAFCSDKRFPCLNWRTVTPGWWTTHPWTSHKPTMVGVSRFQLSHLVVFSASLSYLCAIARFKTGEADAWYQTLQQFGLNNSVRRWCDRLRHTWIPLMQDIKRAGTFFDAQDIMWPDLIQLHLDSGVSVFIYWGKDESRIPHIRKGVIPDQFRPTLAQIQAAPAPPDLTVSRAHLPQGTDSLIPASSGDKRRRNDSTSQPKQSANPAPNLQTLRDHFRRSRAAYHKLEKNPKKVQALRSHHERADRWEVAEKDKGMVWELEKETGIVTIKTYNGKAMQEILEDESDTWLVRYNLGDRVWHRLPDGAFPAPQAVLDRGLDPALRFDRQNAAEFRKIRGPVLTESDWDHLINLQDLVDDRYRNVQYREVSHSLNSVIPALQANMSTPIAASDLQSLIDASSTSATRSTLNARTMDGTHSPLATPVDAVSGPASALIPINAAIVQQISQVSLGDVIAGGTNVRPEDCFARVPFGIDTDLPLDPTDWIQDAACGSFERIRVSGLCASFNRAGFMWRTDEEYAALPKSPIALKPPKNVSALQYCLATLGAWPGYFGPNLAELQWQTALANRLGITPAVSDALIDFTVRLMSAGTELVDEKAEQSQPKVSSGCKPEPRHPRPSSPFRHPDARSWMYAPGSAKEVFGTLATQNVWQVDDVERTVLGAKDGRAQARDTDVKGWLLTRADGHHGRSVVLYNACAVVQVLFNASIETGGELMTYCAESTIRFNEAVSPRPAPEVLCDESHYSARRAAAQALRSSYILGYRAEDQALGAMDFVDYEEARRRLFDNLDILFAAIKAGGIIARLALDHLAPDVVLQGPHADSLELELGARIRQRVGDQTIHWTDDELTPELELFIVGGYFKQVGEVPSDFDSVRTFYPRNVVWRNNLAGPAWDFNKESVYQYYRAKNLAGPGKGSAPYSNNEWKRRLRRWGDQRKLFIAVEHYARAFLETRCEYKYFK